MQASQTGLFHSMVFALAGIALAISPTNVFATALPLTDSGILTIANTSGTVFGITTYPLICINWGGGSTCVQGTTHQMAVSGVSNLFSTATSATNQIKDLPVLPPPTITQFQTVLGAGALAGQTINFDLTSVPFTNGGAGFGDCLSNAPNNVCSPPFSPFTFQENSTGTGVTISFSVTLAAYTGTSASGSTPYVGTFSTDQTVTLSGAGACNGIAANITNILGCQAAGGTITGTWSATEAPVAPTLVPPSITKAFGASTIPLNGTTSLSFTIANPKATGSLSGIGFTDNLPAGLVIATPNGLTGSCGGGSITATAGSGSVSLSGATLAASGSCTFGVNVLGTMPGGKNNTTSPVTSSVGDGNMGSATLAVVAPPQITKSLNPGNILPNGISTLSINLSNPTGNPVSEQGVAVTDNFPQNLVVATPNGLTNSCGGTATATAGSASVSLTGGTIAVGGSCTVTANVTSSIPGQYLNTTGPVSSTNGGTGATSNTASLTVTALPPTFTKTIATPFGAGSLNQGDTTTVSFTVANPNSIALTGLSFTDTLPTGLPIQNPNGLANSCGGSITAVPGAGTISLVGGTVGPTASCTITLSVVVTDLAPGELTNPSVTLTSSEAASVMSAPVSVFVYAWWLWFFY